MPNTQDYLVDVSNLITLPDIYIAIKETIEDPESDMKKLTEVISIDPGCINKAFENCQQPFLWTGS